LPGETDIQTVMPQLVSAAALLQVAVEVVFALPRSVMSTTWRRTLPTSHSDAADTEPVANPLTGAYTSQPFSQYFLSVGGSCMMEPHSSGSNDQRDLCNAASIPRCYRIEPSKPPGTFLASCCYEPVQVRELVEKRSQSSTMDLK